VTGNGDAPQIIALYSKRWRVEPSFRDTKDLRFGLSTVRIGDPQRRDRLLLLNAFAVVLLTLLGAAGESLGMISSPTPSRPAPIRTWSVSPADSGHGGLMWTTLRRFGG
jgi:hypothetical protein